MKAERRHELQTNALASYLAQWTERHKGQLPNVAWGIVIVLAAVIAMSYWGSHRSGSLATAWEEYYSIPDTSIDSSQLANKLKQLAEKYPNTDIALWSRLDLADHFCAEGKIKLETDREIGMTRLREAQQTYALVLQSPRVLPEMIRRGAIAEAKCWELMGDRERAIEAYQSITKKYATSHPDMAKEAASLATELEQPEAADFYHWLAQYKPSSATPLNSFAPDLSFPPTSAGKEPLHGADDVSGSGKPEESPESKAGDPKGSDEPKPKTGDLEAPPNEPSKEKSAPEEPPASAKEEGDELAPEQSNPKE